MECAYYFASLNGIAVKRNDERLFQSICDPDLSGLCWLILTRLHGSCCGSRR